MKKLIFMLIALLALPSMTLAAKGGNKPPSFDAEAAVEEIKLELCNHYVLTGDPVPSICLDFCGDGTKDTFEECDDGNLGNGDGCSAYCLNEDCSSDYANCNGDWVDGCETDISSDPTNCGACGSFCSPTNATPSCSLGECSGTCDTGYGNCNGDWVDGCETDLTNNANCGACGSSCDAGQECNAGICN